MKFSSCGKVSLHAEPVHGHLMVFVAAFVAATAIQCLPQQFKAILPLYEGLIQRI